jgi:hypothetical protein
VTPTADLGTTGLLLANPPTANPASWPAGPLARRPDLPTLRPGLPTLRPGLPTLRPGLPTLRPGLPTLRPGLAGPLARWPAGSATCQPVNLPTRQPANPAT